MWGQKYTDFGNWGAGHWFKLVFFFVILDLILKGFALWRSARNGQNGWFIALLLVNSLGLLPLIYLLTNKEKPFLDKKVKK